MTIIAVYHPPYSTRCPVTNSMFIDDFTEWLPSQLVRYNNILLARDFNIHMNKAAIDDESRLFVSTIKAIGFQAELCGPTHISGSMIDLMSLQSGCSIGVLNMRCGQHLSDHCSIQVTTSVQHTEHHREKISYRKIKSINTESFIADCDLSNLLDNSLEDIVQHLWNKFKNALDTNAPIKTKVAMVRKTVPWFNENLRDHKRIVRNCEWIWKKYKTEETWLAFKIERSKFRGSLKWARKEFVSKSILECDRDNRKLYKLASSLMGAAKENPLPECDTKEDLANQFAEFFIIKIQNIRDRLDSLPVYDHKDSSPPKLAKSEPLMEEEVKQIIKVVPSKCCDLDVIPTSLLKEALELLLPILMKLVNLSLAEGVFIQEWKIALVKPLLKTVGMDL